MSKKLQNIKSIGHYKWLPGVSKRGPFSSGRQSWRKERAIPFPNTNCQPAQEAVQEGHWKYTENPSSLVLSRLPGSGTPLCSFRKTDIPTTCKKAKFFISPSDLHSQGRISMETRGATLRSDWPGKEQHLPTARDQLPKQVHLPLTLHCKCSQTERTHIASSKPQPGVRKAIAHCAPTLSTDMLHYPEKSLRPAKQFNRSTTREPCIPQGTAYDHTEDHSGQVPTPATFNRRTSGPSRKTFSKQRQIFGQYFGDILRERQRLLHGMVTLLLNFYWTYFEFICMNFNELFMNFLKCIVLILCLDYYYVLYWFLLWILIDLMIWKIWLILLTCIAL